MKFFLDENIPKYAINILYDEGHSVIDIRGTKLEGLTDEDIFELAQENKAIFLTTDKDFFHTIPRLYNTHCGIIIFNLKQPNRNIICKKLKWVLQNIDLSDFSSQIILLRDEHYTHKKKE